MTTLTENIINRVDKLPKPSNYAQALQPLFEAISNAKFAIHDKFDEKAVGLGQIEVEISNLSKHGKIEIEVWDNGIGLDETRFEAFCTVDTDYKKEKGGKGVGRLFWLDAFKKIEVSSRYDEELEIAFNFLLREEDQIELIDDLDLNFHGVGTNIKFTGILENEYRKYFPKRTDTFLRYFTSHFISDFLMGVSPQITIKVDDEDYIYPEQVRDFVVEDFESIEWESAKFGEISAVGFLCKSEASAGLDGSHQIHLLGDSRTVETRKIDRLLGLASIDHADAENLCIHVCVDAPFLDSRVNEGRTAFNIPEAQLKKLVREVADKVKETFIARQIATYKIERAEKYKDFIQRYPIFDFDEPEAQLDRMPFGANDPEEFAAGLVKIQVRREEQRYRQI